MYNLIQIQTALQGLPPKDVMKYANGQDPSVPSWLALGELNRRKQLEDTASGFYGDVPNLKDQITSSLTGAPQGQVDPTAAPQGVNPASIPPQLAPTIAAPPKMANPAAPQGQVDPTAPPPMPMAAEGGLMSLPVDMFKQSNYAGGGIVAFAGGGELTPEEIEAAKKPAFTPPNTRRAGEEPTKYEDFNFDAIKSKLSKFLLPDYEAEKKIADLSAMDREDAARAPIAKFPAATTNQPPRVDNAPVANNKQLSNTTSGKINNLVEASDVTKVTPTPKEKALTEYFEEQKALKKLAGVSDDPMADIKARYAKIEAKRATEEEGDWLNSIRAGLSAYSEGSPTDSALYKFGRIGKGMSAFDKETAALRDKQALDMAGLQSAMAKEDDARKRGDVAGATSARKEQREYENKLAELKTQSRTADAAMRNAAAHETSAGAQVMSAKAQMQHYSNETAKLQQMMKENPLTAIMAKVYAESPILQAKFPNVFDYLKTQGLQPNAKNSSENTFSGVGIPKEGDKAQSKSGSPMIFKNGQWEYR